MVKPIIRRATPHDIPQMYAVSLRAHQLSYAKLIPVSRRHDFDARYTASTQAKDRYRLKMSKRIQDLDWYVWVAEVDSKVVGYTLEKRAENGHILKRGLFVDPDYHRQGIGGALFKTSLTIAEKGDTFHLSVIENNYRAKRLYEKHGFVVTGYDTKTFYGARLETMKLTID